MSDTALPTDRPKRNPFAGILPIVVAILLTIIYFRATKITNRWPMPGHVLYRAMVVSLVALGVTQAFRAHRGRFRLPVWFRLSQHWMSIPLEGWIYLAIMFVLFTGAMLTKQNTLLLVFAFMAGPFVINGWMTFGMLQAAQVQRQAPPRAMQGELFPVELMLNNSRPFLALWMMSIKDEVDEGRDTLEPVVLFSRVSPRTEQTGQYQLRLSHRGRYRFGPLRIASRFPLGLVERSRIFPVMGEILIYPRLGQIAPNWRLRLMGATELASRHQPVRGVFHDDFHRLREFRSGDNPKAIHWRSTARRGELILREFHQNREHTLAVVLDLFRPTATTTAHQNLIELALSFVATLLVERGRECRDGFLTLAVSGNQVFRWEGQGHGASLESLFDGLALLQAGPANDSVQVLNDTLQHTSSATQVLVVTTRSSVLPYQALLTSRVDVLNFNEVPADSVLIFDRELPAVRAHASQ